MFKVFLIILILSSAYAQTISAQQKNVDAKKIVTALDSFQNHFSSEKVFIHTDKNYYFIGDKVWLKAYVFSSSTYSYSKKSGLLYIELNDDSLDNVKRISIPIKFGIGWAQIPLSIKQFHEGKYELRAYTNWMKNSKEENFYAQTITIEKPKHGVWLVQSSVNLSGVGSSAKVQVSIKLTTAEKKAVSMQNLQVRLMDNRDLISRQNLQTDQSGALTVNFEPKEYLSKNFSLLILNTQKGESPQLLSIPINFERKEKIDLQFFPEGGNLVAGLTSKLAFKAIGENGLGTNVKGSILDSNGNLVGNFASSHKGMGFLNFEPKLGEKYFGKIDGLADVSKSYPLPIVKDLGTVVAIENLEASDSINVAINFSNNFSLKATENVFLICNSRGFACYTKRLISINQKISIAKNLFPSGISNITLLRDTVLLNERIIFIDHHDNLKLSINTENGNLKDSINVHIRVTDLNGKPVSGSFSMAVTNDEQFKADTVGNYSISTNLLFTSNLRGYIEDPSYYLNYAKTKSWTDLDNLLLTQGWIGIDWTKVFSPPEPKFKAEESFAITGKVINAWAKPLENAQIILSSQKPAFMAEMNTDKNGRFLFKNLPLLDTASFFVMANTPKGKNLDFGELILDKFLPAEIYPSKSPLLTPWYASTDSLILNAVYTELKRQGPYISQSGINLQDVIIKGKKAIPGSYNTRGADLILNKSDIKASGASNLYDLLRSQFPGFKVVMFGGFPTLMYGKYAMHIIINGVNLPLIVSFKPTVQEVVEGLKDYPISSFLGVEIAYSRKYNRIGPSNMDMFNPIERRASNMERISKLQSPDGFRAEEDNSSYTAWRVGNLQNRDFDIGLIFLTTEADSYNYQKTNSANYRPVLTVYPKQFYNPKFIFTGNDTKVNNISTVFWKPDIITNEKGIAQVNFFIRTKKGKFTFMLQGADLNGSVGFVSKSIVLK